MSKDLMPVGSDAQLAFVPPPSLAFYPPPGQPAPSPVAQAYVVQAQGAVASHLSAQGASQQSQLMAQQSSQQLQAAQVQQQMQWQQMQHMQAVNEAMRRGQPLPPPPAPVFAPQTAMVPFGGHGASPGAPQPPPATSLLLDVFVRYAYRGHHGRSWNPLPRLNIPQERRLRLLVDASRTASQIRDEVLARRDIVPDNYGYLGCDMKSQTGFELSDKDVVREIAARGEHCIIEIHYRKDASKGYHKENNHLCRMM